MASKPKFDKKKCLTPLFNPSLISYRSAKCVEGHSNSCYVLLFKEVDCLEEINIWYTVPCTGFLESGIIMEMYSDVSHFYWMGFVKKFVGNLLKGSRYWSWKLVQISIGLRVQIRALFKIIKTVAIFNWEA